MADTDLKIQLDRLVKDVLETYDTGTFRRHWEFYKSTGAINEVKRYYVKIDSENRYFNVAVLGDGKIVDIEGDSNNEAGGLSIRSLSAIGGVILRAGSSPTFPRAQRATLLVVTQLTGGRANGPYWFAENPEEERQLLTFIQPLVDVISAS